MKPPKLHSLLLVAALALGICSCATISDYDQTSYQNATNLKVDTLALMDKATGDYGDHAKDIADLNVEMDKAYEYDNGRPLNTITMAMWDDLRKSYQAFLADWKRKGSLNQTTVRDYTVGPSGTTGISAEFDQIIELESGKNKS
jgi:hypothetical protein